MSQGSQAKRKEKKRKEKLSAECKEVERHVEP
jgi:hypothetical protein